MIRRPSARGLLRHAIAGAAALAFTVAVGCGSPADNADDPAAASQPDGASPSTPAGGPEPTPEPSPASPSPSPDRSLLPSPERSSKPWPSKPEQRPRSSIPAAADGTNTGACSDARCEVAVRAGATLPIPSSTDVSPLELREVTGNRVRLVGEVLGNSSSGYCTGTFCSTSSDNGVLTILMGEDSLAIQNGISIYVGTIFDGYAVIQLEPAE